MAAVGIRELKNKLSDYTKRAEAGERIEITKRGWVIALLVPATERAEGAPNSNSSGHPGVDMATTKSGDE